MGYYLQGQPFDSTLYYDGGDVTVTVQGGKVGIDLFTSSGSPVTRDLYYAGSNRTYKLRRNDSPIYSAYQSGTYYSGGLYANLELAQITTKDVTALTV